MIPIPLQLVIIFSWVQSGNSHQFYDRTSCNSNTNIQGTRYNCTTTNTTRDSCQTFIVFRAKDEFSTIEAISSLFQTDSDTLLSINKNISSSTEVIRSKREVLVPITCSCFSDQFYNAYFNYTSPRNSTVSEIACVVYEGLLKSVTLEKDNENVEQGYNVVAGTTMHVPIKCACLDDIESKDGIKYLITYPLIEFDTTEKISKKFNVSVEEIWKFNGMDPITPTVFPTTTILVPVRDKSPSVDLSVPDSEPPTPEFLPMKPVGKGAKTQEMIKKLYIAGSVVGFCLVLALVISCNLYVRALKKCDEQRMKMVSFSSRRLTSLNSNSTPTRSSMNSCLSPDLLVGIKYSLINYSVEEMKMATRGFNSDEKISGSVYKGVIKNDKVMIKQMRFEETKQVIDFHSRINHVNIVKLRGVCYGHDDCSCSCSCFCSWSYLVFDFPINGSLRDCLLSSSAALHWNRRTQIAFDVATGMHYLHYSVTPVFTGLSLNIGMIFLSSTWRAKIAVRGVSSTSQSQSSSSSQGVGNESVEIFGFGVLLLELISGKEGMDGKVVKETTSFLGGTGGNDGGCFDQLRKFVDPSLKDDYPLAEALCLSVLAGSCVEDDPMHRPSMEDVLKILARMV